MISISRSVPVNPPGTKSPITRAEVWKGLVLKADNALPFVPVMTYCKVIEREGPNVFLRDVEVRGQKLRERVTLKPETQVTFTRVSGPIMGTIHNFIDEKDGELQLRFTFDLQPEDMTPEEEKQWGATMEKDYLGAVDATLAAIRKLHEEGRARMTPPSWLTDYYKNVDAMNMSAFLASHTDDARVHFGNNPPAVGKEQIGQAIGGLWGAIKGLSHKMNNVWQQDGTTILEAAVTYHRQDGKSVTVPCVSLIEERGGKVAQLRVHIDLAPVFAP